MQHHLQRRGEAADLLLPVAEHRRRADDQRRHRPLVCGRALLYVQQVGDQLHRLAEAHVVGETGAEPELAQEAQPGVSVLLVGAELRPQPGGHGELRLLRLLRQLADQPRQMLVQLDLQTNAALPVGIRLFVLFPLGVPIAFSSQQMQLENLLEREALASVHGGHRPANLRQQRRIELDPLAAEAHEPGAPGDQLGELRLRQVDVADGDPPVEVDQRVESEQRSAGAASFAGADFRAQPRLLPAGRLPPGGQQHLPAGGQQPLAVRRQEAPGGFVVQRLREDVARRAVEPVVRQQGEQSLQPLRGTLRDIRRPLAGPGAEQLPGRGQTHGENRRVVLLVLKNEPHAPIVLPFSRLLQLQRGTERGIVRLPADRHEPVVLGQTGADELVFGREEQRVFPSEVARRRRQAVLNVIDRRGERRPEPGHELLVQCGCLQQGPFVRRQRIFVPCPLQLVRQMGFVARVVFFLLDPFGQMRGNSQQPLRVVVPFPLDMAKQIRPGKEGDDHLGRQHDGFYLLQSMDDQLRSVERGLVPSEQGLLQGDSRGGAVAVDVEAVDKSIAIASEQNAQADFSFYRVMRHINSFPFRSSS